MYKCVCVIVDGVLFHCFTEVSEQACKGEKEEREERREGGKERRKEGEKENTKMREGKRGGE